MKYIYKVIELYPDLSIDEILLKCPVDFGVMKCRCKTFADSCIDCWYREIYDILLNKRKV